jgi:hypothetical protein
MSIYINIQLYTTACRLSDSSLKTLISQSQVIEVNVTKERAAEFEKNGRRLTEEESKDASEKNGLALYKRGQVGSITFYSFLCSLTLPHLRTSEVR